VKKKFFVQENGMLKVGRDLERNAKFLVQICSDFGWERQSDYAVLTNGT